MTVHPTPDCYNQKTQLSLLRAKTLNLRMKTCPLNPHWTASVRLERLQITGKAYCCYFKVATDGPCNYITGTGTLRFPRMNSTTFIFKQVLYRENTKYTLLSIAAFKNLMKFLMWGITLIQLTTLS
ncbi:uncharacterized protein VP01_2557g2 [Puccinia sorghi]|uniref:Uncharacterized protein n=1 Tax=Puccinia sorghi TaxID=27349 RepID=A0A0L6V5T4_9BASI|nr:uncharacterized protein VP01_2557g2 [Puccinia sorghi]